MPDPTSFLQWLHQTYTGGYYSVVFGQSHISFATASVVLTPPLDRQPDLIVACFRSSSASKV
jgi:hypothetical protein